MDWAGGWVGGGKCREGGVSCGECLQLVSLQLSVCVFRGRGGGRKGGSQGRVGGWFATRGVRVYTGVCVVCVCGGGGRKCGRGGWVGARAGGQGAREGGLKIVNGC